MLVDFHPDHSSTYRTQVLNSCAISNTSFHPLISSFPLPKYSAPSKNENFKYKAKFFFVGRKMLRAFFFNDSPHKKIGQKKNERNFLTLWHFIWSFKQRRINILDDCKMSRRLGKKIYFHFFVFWLSWLRQWHTRATLLSGWRSAMSVMTTWLNLMKSNK